MRAVAKPASMSAARRMWPLRLLLARLLVRVHLRKIRRRRPLILVSGEGRKLWADEPVAEDIDLATVTPEQLPEL